MLGLSIDTAIPEQEKINLNFYFYTLQCLKKSSEGLKGLNKTFRATTMKFGSKNLS